MKVTPFETYQTYLSMKSHFTNPKYDFFKYGGKSRATITSFNKRIISKRIVSICDYLNLDKSFESFLNWVLDLRKQLNIPHKLSEVVEENKIDIDQLSQMALDDPSTATNPIKMELDDMKLLYVHSISGKLF